MLRSLFGLLGLFLLAALLGVFRLLSWPIRQILRHWPGRRERLLKASAAQLQREIAAARQLVAVLAADLPELQIAFSKQLRRTEKLIDRVLAEQGEAEDLEGENPWQAAIKLLDKAKRVQGFDSQSDAAGLNKPSHIPAQIDEGSDTYVLALCTPDQFARIEGLTGAGYSVRRFEPGAAASAHSRFRRHTQRRQLAGYHEAGPHVPEPIPGRVGWLGGIESLSIDERRYYFGFCYSDDQVLSPLLEDKQVMAEFAAAYIAQKDGVAHGIDYWMESVETAIEHSALCDDASRTLTTPRLRAFAAGLTSMQHRNMPSPDLQLDHHLIYLLSACLGEDDRHFLEPGPELERLGLRSREQEEELDTDELSGLLEIGRGEQPLPSGASFVDVAVVVRDYFKRTSARLPENWSLLYGSLIAEA